MKTPLLALFALACTGGTPSETGSSGSDDTGDGGGGDSGTVDCETTGLNPGDCAPNFTLKNADGVDIELSELRGQRLVVAGSSMW